MLVDFPSMTRARRRIVSVALAAAALAGPAAVRAEGTPDLIRETLRQASPAERAACTGVRRTLAAGNDATRVVRTAVELGFNPCEVLRCALEGVDGDERDRLCRLAVLGAAQAGVPADVIARCTAAACDPVGVAALLAAALREPNYCYVGSPPPGAPAAGQTAPVVDRAIAQPPEPPLPPPPLPPVEPPPPPPQISPFAFPSGP
jgi:hypothetical protein